MMLDADIYTLMPLLMPFAAMMPDARFAISRCLI